MKTSKPSSPSDDDSDPFSHSLAFVLGIARELYRYAKSERKGHEMPVGRTIREYVLKCSKQSYVDVRVCRTPLAHTGELPMRGAVSVYDNNGEKSAWIRYSSELNRCWSRFVVCKEYIHLLIDRTPESRSPFALEQLRDVLTNLDSISKNTDSELLAMLGALEYLLPYDERPVDLGENEEEAILEISTKFRVPRYWVSILYKNPTYKRASDEYHKKLKAMGQ